MEIYRLIFTHYINLILIFKNLILNIFMYLCNWFNVIYLLLLLFFKYKPIHITIQPFT